MNRYGLVYKSRNKFHSTFCELFNSKSFNKIQRGNGTFETFLYNSRSCSFISTHRRQMTKTCLATVFRSYSDGHHHHHRPSSPTYLYEVLHVTPRATLTQIKNSYFKLSKIYHPDVNQSPEALRLFHEISEAYEVLGNPRKRRLYDRGILPSELHKDIHHHGDGEPATRAETFKHMHFEPRHKRPPMGKTDIYNFDEFYKMHYGDHLDREAKENARRRMRKIHEKEFESDADSRMLIIIFGLFIGFVAYRLNQSDNRLKTKHKDNSVGSPK